MRTHEQLQAAVDRGAAWLDEYEPYWWKHIELATFDISSPCRCVLGQVYAIEASAESCYSDGFEYACGKLFKQASDDDINMGFDVTGEGDEEDMMTEYSSLQGMWIEKINERIDT